MKQVFIPDGKINLYSDSEQINIQNTELALSQIFEQKPDVIELDKKLFNEYVQLGKPLPLDVDQVKYADILVKHNNDYWPFFVSGLSMNQLFSVEKVVLNKSSRVLLVGDKSLMDSFLPSLVKLGFKNFIFLTNDEINLKQSLQNYSKVFFSSEIEIYSYARINQIDSDCGLMISLVDFSKEPDLSLNLTYFNFMSQGAYFLDLASKLSLSLSEEAEKAGLNVLSFSKFVNYDIRSF